MKTASSHDLPFSRNSPKSLRAVFFENLGGSLVSFENWGGCRGLDLYRPVGYRPQTTDHSQSATSFAGHSAEEPFRHCSCHKRRSFGTVACHTFRDNCVDTVQYKLGAFLSIFRKRLEFSASRAFEASLLQINNGGSSKVLRGKSYFLTSSIRILEALSEAKCFLFKGLQRTVHKLCGFLRSRTKTG